MEQFTSFFTKKNRTWGSAFYECISYIIFKKPYNVYFRLLPNGTSAFFIVKFFYTDVKKKARITIALI
uniref:hypothetical protein n=1 Tax=uncultured Megasphaera sp. TaxID=165188 RepID=UPI00258FC069